MVTPGGEVAFVSRMIEESVALKTKCQWYTSMLGKLSSVGTVVEKLKNIGLENFAVKEFVQGGKTRRWGIAWSWDDMRPTQVSQYFINTLSKICRIVDGLSQNVARGISSLPKHLMPFPSDFIFALPKSTLENAPRRLNAILEPLDLQWKYRPSLSTGVGFASANVWSRAARRQRQKGGTADDDSKDETDGEREPALGFKVQLRLGREKQGVEVSVRWLKGRDSVLYESFCGMLKRQLSSS